ncbi:MFS transporter [Sphingomonas azotifigens]|uniref:MFS transporter n=1 Tax=Sphingomonas azotifigens TaxID=330920 RepID=UPI000A05F9AA|nr:MFS transporter [Sphingomonas azotifigens]
MTDPAIPSTRNLYQSAGEVVANEVFHLRGYREVGFVGTLLLVSIVCQVDRILPFILIEPIKRDLDLSDAQIGLVTGLASALCYTLFSLPIARTADRGSPRLVLLGCVLVWSAMTGLGGLATSFAALAASRFGVALGEAGAIPAAHALIARRIAPDRRGRALGLFSMGIPLGTMLGFALGGVVADAHGWRTALLGAGIAGAVLAILVAGMGPTPPLRQQGESVPFLKTGRVLLASRAFRWLLLAAVGVGFASAPFYAFAASFLIRVHGFSAAQAGLAFGLLQGSMGLVGTLLGGRDFDRRRSAGNRFLLATPATLFLVAGTTASVALFVPIGWLATALLVPTMLSFAFMLPGAFGAAHLVAGAGHQAMASSMVLIASGLLGPTLAPLLVGAASDAAGDAGIRHGLRFGLLLVPIASVLTAAAMLVANRHIAAAGKPAMA